MAPKTELQIAVLGMDIQLARIKNAASSSSADAVNMAVIGKSGQSIKNKQALFYIGDEK